MTNKENVERNIGLTFDLVNHMIDNPDSLDKIPDNAAIQFVEKDFPAIEAVDSSKRKVQKSKKVRVRNSFELTS